MADTREVRWGTLPDGRTARLFTITSDEGLTAEICDYGGIIRSFLVPDRDGVPGDIVLGYDSFEEYLRNNGYFGALIGRYANRIKGGRFTLGGTGCELTRNEGKNHLHGGGAGFDRKLWSVEDATAKGLLLKLESPGGEEGFPGSLTVTASIGFTAGRRLAIEFRAVSDRDTILNLTGHSYFNLAGSGDILDHELRINADRYTPVDAELIPTGEIRHVAGTGFDFRTPRRIEGDYDHNFVIRPGEDACAEASDPKSGRRLRVYTSMPGIQFYSGGMTTERRGKNGAVYGKNSGFCLEPQFFPNSPNEPAFPSCVLKAGETYIHNIVYCV